jgi:endoglucanase
MPGDGNKEPKMGEGITVTLSPITNRKLSRMLIAEAEAKEMKIQREVITSHTGTNTMSVNLIRGGVPTVDVGLPLKNMHTYNEVVSLDDAAGLSAVMKIFITSKEIAEVFGR